MFRGFGRWFRGIIVVRFYFFCLFMTVTEFRCWFYVVCFGGYLFFWCLRGYCFFL